MDVADLLEIDLRSYQEYEAHVPPKKGFNPSVLTLRNLAQRLQISVADLTREPESAEMQALTSEKKLDASRSRVMPRAPE